MITVRIKIHDTESHERFWWKILDVFYTSASRHYAITAIGYLSYCTAITVSCALLKVNVCRYAHKLGIKLLDQVGCVDLTRPASIWIRPAEYSNIPDPTREQLWCRAYCITELSQSSTEALSTAKLIETNLIPYRNHEIHMRILCDFSVRNVPLYTTY